MKLNSISTNKLDYYHFGTVVDVSDNGYNDTGLPVFRVKVKIDNLTDNIDKEYLPWYVVKQSPSDSYNEHGRIPRVGMKVLVEFPYDDFYNGIVSFQLPNTPPEMR